MTMPPSVQMAIMNKHKGVPMKRLEYILEVAEGYYKCQKIYHELRKLQDV